MNMPVGVIRAVASLLIAHNAQNGRRTGLQHINNNHPDTTAKDPQHTTFGAALQSPGRSLGAFALAAVVSGIPRGQRCQLVINSRCLEQVGRFAPRARPLTGG